MSKDKKKSGMGKFFFGAAVGAGLGLLFAPDKGSVTRRKLKNKIDDFIEEIKNIDVEEVKDNLQFKIEELKLELADLDKEKVLTIAKDKAKQIKNKSEELVKLAVEKGTPVIQDAAEEIRKGAVVVTKEVLDRLEKKEK